VRVLAHISDLHFGREDPLLAEALLGDLAATSPSVVAVSGDLTQRARRREFEAARAWIARLPAPAVVVPGNHDVPLFNLWARLTASLDRFRLYIEPEPLPLHADPELVVVGLSTARALTSSAGWITSDQVETLQTRLASAPPDALRVLVAHHPFVAAPGRPHPGPMRGADEALAALERCGVDLLLGGHAHLSYWGDARQHYRTLRRSILFVQAGTATSKRRRGEPNAWNRIVIHAGRVEVEPRVWDGRRFAPRTPTVFRRTEAAWETTSA
jgi:3',5'-cyclic AMP phosphodiesterase CpdA